MRTAESAVPLLSSCINHVHARPAPKAGNTNGNVVKQCQLAKMMPAGTDSQEGHCFSRYAILPE
jgi:hypothetical protein